MFPENLTIQQSACSCKNHMNRDKFDLCSGRDRNLPARTIVSSMFSVASPPEYIYIISRNVSSNNKTKSTIMPKAINTGTAAFS